MEISANQNITVQRRTATRINGHVWDLINRRAGLSLTVTEEGGGRLLQMKLRERDIAYFQPELFAQIPKLLDKNRKDVNWEEVGLGGEKTWVAPQNSFGGGVPFLDLNLGKYNAQGIENGVALTSPICRETGLQIQREITLEDGAEGKFTIKAQVSNHSSRVKEAAPWSVFQLVKPATVNVGPLTGLPEAFKNEGAGIMPQGILRQISDNYYALALKAGGDMFKAGFHFIGADGSMEIRFTGGVSPVFLKIDFAVPDGTFPHGYRAELFDWQYFEAEFLGPLEQIAPGKSSEALVVHYHAY
jgi:hypothetical protein